MTSSPEYRYLAQEFRISGEGEEPTISGYAAVFDSPSEDLGGWVETIDPHAFDSVLATNPDVRALWNHNPDHVLGRTAANTLTLTLDSRGLAYVIHPPQTTLAADLMTSMRRKDVTQSSFSFICKRDQWTENADGTVSRRILEFDSLLDISPVTYPAYSATTSQARHLPASMPAEIRSRFKVRDAQDGDPEPIDPCDDICECACSQCRAGAHGICSADPQCQFANRSERSFDPEHERLKMRLALLTLK